MLTPEYLQGLPKELENLSLDLEEYLIDDICRRIKKVGSITDTAAYEIMRLKEMGAATEYIEKKIAEFTELSEAAVKQAIFDAAQTDNDFYREVYQKSNRPFVPYRENKYLQQLTRGTIEQTCGQIRSFTKSAGFMILDGKGRLVFTPSLETYRNTMNQAFRNVSTGSMDYFTAIRRAEKELAENGMYFVDFDSGHRDHADVAIRRALLTGVSQLAANISKYNAEQLGTNIVEVTAHAGARPAHAAWQGGWYSLSGKDETYNGVTYKEIVKATGYGTGAGLMGWNCRHTFFPVVPGIDKPSYTEEELKNIDPPPVKIDGRTYTYYEAEQRQRYMERSMRKTKRQLIAADANGDTETFTAKSVKLRRQKEEYRKFSKAAGLLPREERASVFGYGHSISSKSAWAVRKAAMKNNGGSDPSGSSAATAKTPKTPKGGNGGHGALVDISPKANNGGTGKIYQSENLTNKKNGGKMDTRNILNIYTGVRSEQNLTDNEKKLITEYFSKLGGDPDMMMFSDNQRTVYNEKHDYFIFGTDVKPLENAKSGTKSANQRVSIKATVAHEYIGHRAAHIKGKTQYDNTYEEVQASIRAARFAPDLTRIERITLLRDARSRLDSKTRLKDIKDLLYISEV